MIDLATAKIVTQKRKNKNEPLVLMPDRAECKETMAVHLWVSRPVWARLAKKPKAASPSVRGLLTKRKKSVSTRAAMAVLLIWFWRRMLDSGYRLAGNGGMEVELLPPLSSGAQVLGDLELGEKPHQIQVQIPTEVWADIQRRCYPTPMRRACKILFHQAYATAETEQLVLVVEPAETD